MASVAKRRLEPYQHQDTVKKFSSVKKVTAQWVLLLDQIENEAFKHSSENSSSLIFVFELALKKKKRFWKECRELPSVYIVIAGRKEKISCSVLKKKELHIDQWV